MLDELNKSHSLFLYSKGEAEIQIKKILMANMDSYFTGVWITKAKTVKQLTKQMLENKLNIKTTWVLGNSPKNDLGPALEIGVNPENCILIESYMWEEDKLAITAPIHRIKHLSEVVPLTKKLVLVG